MRDVHREMRVVRLGQGVDATGVLAPEAIERARVALADYTAIMRRKGVERVRMVATSATRDAANRDDFFTMVRSTLGADAEVISGDEEARLSFAARWASSTLGRPVRRRRRRAAVHRAGRRRPDDGRRDRARRLLRGHRQRAHHRALPARRPAVGRRGGRGP
jgi:hypothetical protein